MLSRGLSEMVQSGHLAVYSLPQGSFPISHLCFADDLIIFTKGFRSSIRNLFAFLGDYERSTGQRINRAKSTFVISKHAGVQHVRIVARLSGVSQGKLPQQYLGHLIFKGRKKVQYFQPLLDKVTQRLSGWQGRLLSPGGRLIFIKHVLASIPLYTMAAMEPPRTLLSKIEILFAKFFWGDLGEEHRRVWRSWTCMCYPIEENGLGVRSLRDLVIAFSCKLWWRWGHGAGIWAKYVQSIALCSSVVYKRLVQVDELMRDNVQFEVGAGTCSFLYENWTGEGSLFRLFDLQYSDSLRGIRLCDAFVHGRWSEAILTEVLPEVAIRYVTQFTFQLSQSLDVLIWKPSISGMFTLKSAFDLVRQQQVVTPELKFVWDTSLPLKAFLLCWRLMNNLLPLPETLMSFGFHLVSKCPTFMHQMKNTHIEI